MSNPIVVVQVSLAVAPIPPTLQQTGALISQGGTILAPLSSSLLTQLSDLTPLLTLPAALTSLTEASGVVTAVTTEPHDLPVGQVINLTIAGATPAGYNGTFPCTITTTTGFTYSPGLTLGTNTVPGTWINGSAGELVEMATTFFAQGGSQSVFVLELGAVGVTAAVEQLTAYTTEFPNNKYTPGALGFFYGYLVPREWDANAQFLSLIQSFQAPSARTYFWTTTTLSTFQNYTTLDKDIIALIENPVLQIYPQIAISAISFANGLVTATTASPHGILPGTWFQLQGFVPNAYNGFHQAAVGTTGSTLIYAAPSSPGTETTLGVLEASSFASSGIGLEEFSLAASFWLTLNQRPSSTNQVTQLDYTPMFGVTPFQQQGMGSTTSNLQTAHVNYVGTGAEGGLSGAIMINGTTMDGNDFLSFWYSTDFIQIGLDENLANEVINGSATPVNPLYYNQQGIDRLQNRASDFMTNVIQVGLANGVILLTSLDPDTLNANIDAGMYVGNIVVNAVPFLDYTTENPDDYGDRQYNGITVVTIPQLGFNHLLVNVLVTEILTAS
jgi:hypothetical protein